MEGGGARALIGADESALSIIDLLIFRYKIFWLIIFNWIYACFLSANLLTMLCTISLQYRANDGQIDVIWCAVICQLHWCAKSNTFLYSQLNRMAYKLLNNWTNW